MRIFAFVAFVALLILAGVAIEVSVWTECRADHSWLYCVRLVSH